MPGTWIARGGLAVYLAVAIVSCQSDKEQSNAEEPLDSCGFTVVSAPAGCDGCHGVPPSTKAHLSNTRCFRCHGVVIGSDMAFANEALHADGVVQVNVGCTSCHGWDQGTSPPQDLVGSCDSDTRGVGAHRAMRRTAILAHRVNCTNCHVVPLSMDAVGHLDGDNRAEVRFAMLATAQGAAPSWDGTSCTNVYCHGATLPGGTLKAPQWLDRSGAPSQCGACHHLSDPQGNPDADCSACHPTSVASDRTILPMGTHLNGFVEIGG